MTHYVVLRAYDGEATPVHAGTDEKAANRAYDSEPAGRGMADEVSLWALDADGGCRFIKSKGDEKY